LRRKSLSRSVGIALGVFDSHEQGGSAPEKLRERADETNAAAAANGRWFLLEAGAHRLGRCIESRSVRIRHPPVDRADRLDRDLHAPWWILGQEATDLLVDFIRVLIGHNAATDKCVGFWLHLVRGMLVCVR